MCERSYVTAAKQPDNHLCSCCVDLDICHYCSTVSPIRSGLDWQRTRNCIDRSHQHNTMMSNSLLPNLYHHQQHPRPRRQLKRSDTYPTLRSRSPSPHIWRSFRRHQREPSPLTMSSPDQAVAALVSAHASYNTLFVSSSRRWLLQAAGKEDGSTRTSACASMACLHACMLNLVPSSTMPRPA